MHFGIFIRKIKTFKIQDFGNVIIFIHEGYFDPVMYKYSKMHISILYKEKKKALGKTCIMSVFELIRYKNR